MYFIETKQKTEKETKRKQNQKKKVKETEERKRNPPPSLGQMAQLAGPTGQRPNRPPHGLYGLPPETLTPLPTHSPDSPHSLSRRRTPRTEASRLRPEPNHPHDLPTLPHAHHSPPHSFILPLPDPDLDRGNEPTAPIPVAPHELPRLPDDRAAPRRLDAARSPHRSSARRSCLALAAVDLARPRTHPAAWDLAGRTVVDPCFVYAAGSRPGGHHVDVRIIAPVCLRLGRLALVRVATTGPSPSSSSTADPSLAASASLQRK